MSNETQPEEALVEERPPVDILQNKLLDVLALLEEQTLEEIQREPVDVVAAYTAVDPSFIAAIANDSPIEEIHGMLLHLFTNLAGQLQVQLHALTPGHLIGAANTREGGEQMGDVQLLISLVAISAARLVIERRTPPLDSPVSGNFSPETYALTLLKGISKQFNCDEETRRFILRSVDHSSHSPLPA